MGSILIHVANDPGTADALGSQLCCFPFDVHQEILERGFVTTPAEIKSKCSPITVLIERLEILFFRSAFDREEDKGLHLFAMRATPEPT